MLVDIATRTITIIVGKLGSSKTLAMMILQNNLSSAQKHQPLPHDGLYNYCFISF